MKRTSVFLDERLLVGLKRVARRDGVSVASLIRESVSVYLAEPRTSARVPSIAGRFASGGHDTAERVDDLLWRDPHG